MWQVIKALNELTTTEIPDFLFLLRGISYEKVLLNLFKVYVDPANLVLVLNSDDYEENYYTKLLNSPHVHQASNNSNEREKVYLSGGVQFISTQVLVLDLIKNRVPAELITGIFVLRAHQIIESCQEAFALRLFRQKNKTGFIKAFTLSAESFTFGYGHVVSFSSRVTSHDDVLNHLTC